MNMPNPKEAAALLTALAERQNNDPLSLFEPHAKQRELIEGYYHSKKRIHLAAWANRTGKTDAGAYIDASLARYGNPDPKPDSYGNIQVKDRATSSWIVSQTFRGSREIIQPKIFDNGAVPPGQPHAPFIPKREINEWRVADQMLKLKNGSIVSFMSCDMGREKFQGTGKDHVHFDEEPTKSVFEEVTLRSEAGRDLKILLTCTLLPPEGEVGGISWIYHDIIEPWKKGNRDAIDVYTASMYDNPHLDPTTIAWYESLYPPGSLARRIRIDGELLPGITGSRAYGNFHYDMHVEELKEPDPRRPLVWCWDFNVSPMITLVGQRNLKRFSFYDELVIEDDASIENMCDMFYETYGHWKGQIWIYGDQTGEGRNVQTATSNYKIIQNRMKQHSIHPRIKLPTKNPFVRDRLNAVNHMLLDEEGTAYVEIDPKCAELIADLEGVLMDPRGGIKKSHKPEDPYYRRTHSSDSAGYWISYEEPIRELTLRERAHRIVRDPGYSLGR